MSPDKYGTCIDCTSCAQVNKLTVCLYTYMCTAYAQPDVVTQKGYGQLVGTKM